MYEISDMKKDNVRGLKEYAHRKHMRTFFNLGRVVGAKATVVRCFQLGTGFTLLASMYA